jgi:hypothetical protein
MTPFVFGVLAAVDAVQRAADALGWLVSRQQLTAALVRPPAASAGVDHDALRKELRKRLEQGKLVLPCMERARYPGIGRKLMVAPRPLAGVDQQTTNRTNLGRLSPRHDQVEGGKVGEGIAEEDLGVRFALEEVVTLGTGVDGLQRLSPADTEEA